MKAMLIKAVGVALLGWALMSAGDARLAAAGCGPTPPKPPAPPGCRGMVAQCVCDSKGANCHYVWVCVK